MGEIYKQVGGWKGIQKDILFPLAEYQKSQGMDTSFTRLYDAYRKVDPIWRKLHEEKEQPRVGMGDLRVVEEATNGGFGSGRQTSGMDAGAGLIQSPEDNNFGTNGSNYFASKFSSSAVGDGDLVWSETNQGFKQSFEAGEDYSELAKRLRSYFRRPFDRWENYDVKDNSFFLDRLKTDGSSWSDLNQRQQVKLTPEPLEEAGSEVSKALQWSGRRGRI